MEKSGSCRCHALQLGLEPGHWTPGRTLGLAAVAGDMDSDWLLGGAGPEEEEECGQQWPRLDSGWGGSCGDTRLQGRRAAGEEWGSRGHGRAWGTPTHLLAPQVSLEPSVDAVTRPVLFPYYESNRATLKFRKQPSIKKTFVSGSRYSYTDGWPLPCLPGLLEGPRLLPCCGLALAHGASAPLAVWPVSSDLSRA